jgi:hypothetical protein
MMNNTNRICLLSGSDLPQFFGEMDICKAIVDLQVFGIFF